MDDADLSLKLKGLSDSIEKFLEVYDDVVLTKKVSADELRGEAAVNLANGQPDLAKPPLYMLELVKARKGYIILETFNYLRGVKQFGPRHVAEEIDIEEMTHSRVERVCGVLSGVTDSSHYD